MLAVATFHSPQSTKRSLFGIDHHQTLALFAQAMWPAQPAYASATKPTDEDSQQLLTATEALPALAVERSV